jgi:hypothetical protein
MMSRHPPPRNVRSARSRASGQGIVRTIASREQFRIKPGRGRADATH